MLPRLGNLPLQLTRFVGRQPELAHVRQLVSEERLVTLTGTGGVGKTRLALEVAASMRGVFPDGVWLAELGSLGEAALVAQAVAAPLGIRPEAGLPLEQTVANFLRPRRVLLVLDNCEHLVDACATLAERLLGACPDLWIMATSREPLRVAGESRWRVPSLAVPPSQAPLSPEVLLQYAAVRLLVDRASAAGDFALTEQTAPAVARLAQRLDGIPLALELAAARVPALGVTELAGRLDESLRLLVDGSRTAPARHRTLQATIDWSYELLAEPERALLDRLSVFAGGFTSEAAEFVADGPGLEGASILSLLGHLVDRSLVVAEPIRDGTVRYRLLEVLRQYGQARLTQRGELGALRGRHAAYFLALVQRAEPRVLRGERDRWQDRLELELDNFRASRAWFVHRGDTESLLCLNAYLFLLLAYRGYASEGRASLLEALAMPGGSPALRARALHCLALLAYLQADYPAAAEHGEHSLRLRQRIGNDAELAWSLLERGTTAIAQADFAAGRSLLQQACDASRRSGQRYVLAYGVALCAQVDYLQGDFRAARARANEALELGDALGFVAPTSHALATLGEVSYLEADRQAAAVALRSALDKVKAPGEVLLLGRPLLGLALIAVDQGDSRGACVLLTESLELAQRLSNAHRVAQSLERISAFAAGAGDLGHTWRFAGAAAAIRDRLGAPLSRTERRILDERLGTPRRSAAMAALQEGRTWSVDRACTRARAFLNSSAPIEPSISAGEPISIDTQGA